MGAYPVKFGKYLLLERVNVGGMAEVFKAKTFGVAGFERILAIKRILPSLVEDDEFIRMFIDEARIAVQLNHANIVQIYELGKHGDHYYIAMEYLPSRDLRSILDRLRSAGQLMPIAQAAFITSKVCEGLDYAHRRRDPSGEPMNIIHRDVSPQNILITFEGDIKVIDFGIAKAANRASKTQAGVLKGKFGYMSPEQVRGLPIDRRSDIFAVGVLLYEMLTGERLFIGESDFSTLERVRNAEVIPPTTFNKKITPDLEQIVLKALAREAEDRYQWSSDLGEDLQSFLIEDRSIYNPKRLGIYMKETYAQEIAHERSKMEEFLSLVMDGASEEEVSHRSKEALPSPYVAVKAHASVETNTDPLSLPDDGIDLDVEDADQFEEDKTFVIEASDAGKALGPAEKARAEALERSDPSTRAPRVPEHTDDDFLAGASLYGEDASDLEDEAATMVSMANPFDENQRGTDEGAEPNDGRTMASFPDANPHSETHAGFDAAGAGGTDPQAIAMGAHSATHHDASVSLPSGRSQGGRSMTGQGQETGAITSGVSGPIPADPDEPTRAGDPLNLGDDVAGRQLPAQVRRDEPMRNGGDATPPTLDHIDSTERAPRAPEPPVNGMSRGVMAALVVGVAVAFLAFVGVAIGVVVKVTADDTVPIVLAPPDSSRPPTSVKVFLDGELVAESLPVQVLLAEAPGQVLRVEADGYQPLELPLPQVSAALSPLTLPMKRLSDVDDSGGGAVGSDDPEPDPEERKPPGDVVARPDARPTGDEKPDDNKPDDKKPDSPASEGKGSAVAVSAQPSDDEAPDEDTVATATELAAAAGPSWRVSFTAVADGAPVHGARVMKGGQLVGTTPFEIELASNVERVALVVNADGYAAKQLDIARAGRQQVGPATIALVRPPAGVSPDEGVPEGGGDVVDPGGAGSQGAGANGKAPEPAGQGSNEDKNPAAAADNTAAAQPAADKPAADKPAADKPAADKPAADKPAADKPAADKPAVKDPAPAAARAQQPRQQRKARDRRVELSLGTRPFAHVIVDGRKQAQTTPLMGARALKLKPGDHIIQFVDTKTNKKYRYKVSLPADSPKNKLIIILGGDIRVKEGKAKAVELK